MHSSAEEEVMADYDTNTNESLKLEPIWDEEKVDIEGPLERALKNFDPTIMPDPEHSCHLLRKRVKIVE